MKAAELREMSPEDLNKQLLDLLKEQFNLRMQKASGQLTKYTLLGETKRDIARVKTILKEKQGK